LCWLVAQSVFAQTTPRLTPRVRYYDISGETARDLRHEMNRLRPQVTTGPRTDAYTQWWIQWTARYRNTDAGTVIASLDTRVDVLHYLPRWNQLTNAPPELARQWRDYMRALVVHEKGHQDIAVQAAAEFARLVAAETTLASVARADERVRTICNEVVARYRQREEEFDRTTRHGETQGAHFP
jgi:predicted secreted Zn-dependent protease